MNPISDRAIVKILNGPTPLTPLNLRPRSTLIKRDDVLIDGIGGNKARKLEFVLGDLKRRNISEIITFGAWGSNHLLTTALCAKKFGFQMTAHLSPQPITEDVRKKLLTLKSLGAKMIAHPTALSLAISILKNKKHPGFVDPGASSPLGALGYVKAAFELIDQLKERDLATKKIQIFVPLGSAGTVAGLLAGFSLAGFENQVQLVGVQTVPIYWNFGSWGVFHLVRKILELCETDGSQRKILLNRAQKMWKWSAFDYRPRYGEAYLPIHQTIERVLKTERVPLDVTYTGKAMHRFLASVESGPEDNDQIQIFWNTFPKYPLETLSKDVDWRTLPAQFHFIFE